MAPHNVFAGIFITIEGLDGSGKTTIADRLAEALRREGRSVVLTREPGGTAIGERIRGVLFGPESAAMAPQTEALLFAAARAQHVAELMRPALASGAVVVCDRFADSSFAYQWGGRGLDRDAVCAAQALATSGVQPDLKILLDLPVAVSLRRKLRGGASVNRLDRETVAFHERVRDAYLLLAAEDPSRWLVVDADRAPDEVWRDVWAGLAAKVLVSPVEATAGHQIEGR